jgi:anaerobic selenocysteine-containing dehydrogenase
LETYPYTLITGRRIPGFFHTENRQLPWMRGLQRDPVVEIHPETAAKEGIREGDWVVIESLRGKIRQRAKFFKGLRPEVISAEHAWWFPEEKENHGDWESSNVNMLIDNSYDNCDPAMGATHIRSLLCRIYPEDRIEE